MHNRWPRLVLSTMLLLAYLLTACSPISKTPGLALVPALDEQSLASTIKRSLAFLPNVGQADSAILFHTLSSPNTLLFAHHGVAFVLPSSNQAAGLFGTGRGLGDANPAASPDPALLHMRFLAASPDAKVGGQD